MLNTLIGSRSLNTPLSISGWQFQASPPTVQCIVEKALIQVTKLERECLHFVGASRTDTGVHAWGQVAHFITPFNYDSLESVHAALNGLLPSDIRVREISAAIPEFHARFSVKNKVYHYKIYNDSIMDPFQRHYACHSTYKLNACHYACHSTYKLKQGSGFLYRQVQNMVALLIQIGKEAVPTDIVSKILATRDRRELAKYTLAAPPHGLCLMSIKYGL